MFTYMLPCVDINIGRTVFWLSLSPDGVCGAYNGCGAPTGGCELKLHKSSVQYVSAFPGHNLTGMPLKFEKICRAQVGGGTRLAKPRLH